MANGWMVPKRKRKPPYVEALILRKGERVYWPATGRSGEVSMVISSKRYVIDFGAAGREIVPATELQFMGAGPKQPSLHQG